MENFDDSKFAFLTLQQLPVCRQPFHENCIVAVVETAVLQSFWQL